jgi:hypothetical protein
VTKDRKVIKPKIGVLELAKQLGNVSQACRVMGYSRKPGLKNCPASEIEGAVVEMALAQPIMVRFALPTKMTRSILSRYP